MERQSNTKEYNSVEDYLNDPINKPLYNLYLENKFIAGIPTHLQTIYKLKYDNKTFELEGYMYNIIPNEWYSEHFGHIGEKLSLIDEYETYEECRLNIGTPVEDLFGERNFPVIKFKHDKDLQFYHDVGNYFKGSSTPLVYEGNVYIRLRSKLSEIDYLENVYKNNGKVLKDVQWDWE